MSDHLIKEKKWAIKAFWFERRGDGVKKKPQIMGLFYFFCASLKVMF